MSKYTIPNLKNACLALKLMAEQKSGISIGEMGEHLGVPRTSMLRILTTLEDEGFVQREGRTYQIGPMMLGMGLKAFKKSDIRELAGPVLNILAVTTGETAHLAQLTGKQALIARVCESPNPVRAASKEGTLADIHCSATGKIMLAFAVSDLSGFLDGVPLVKRTPHTSVSVKALAKEIREIQARGYSIDNEEYSIGVRCLAAPVRNASGKVEAAIGITASTVSFPQERIPEIADRVISAAEDLSLKLGGSVDA
ncbi:IclR family transcriptional regulator [Luteolibacter algae]|uniref:IclR family transcriptional regulator n=1 Tax=Luteolibacter algae TaxID=454151 RepID=A0ABW5DEP8_9BACT